MPPDESILIYTKLPDDTGGCPFCDVVKAWFDERKIAYAFVELGPEGRQALYNRLKLEGSRRTVPQIMLIDNEGVQHRIGGSTELTVSKLETLFLASALL